MATPRTKRPVVVGVDPDPAHRLALNWAADEASLRHLPLRLVLAQGMPTIRVTEADLVPSWEEWNRTLHTTGQRALDDAVAFVEAHYPQLPLSAQLAEGEPAWVLREQARDAAMVVLGSNRLPAAKEMFTSASVALPLMAHAPCPVVVVRRSQDTSEERPHYVVGVDGSPTCQAAINFAFEEAALHHASLRAIWAWHRPVLGSLDEHAAQQECRELLSEAVSGRASVYPDVELHHEVVPGHPVDVLTRESAHALGLVIGTRGHGGFTGMLLGSVGHGALHHAVCPLITVGPQTE
ncbi:universal stress protein [Streptomyces silvisoli]|uniref:Universal stress protein n=1 Tax=Streptomyces silvisoli TaxID=3034235 RepID=A0ABT5ZV32_9ACTN|nr:universal stress protein [Streptomyces silvisoli]MDF3293606.1 universal stress protein [Streptomyces silvisoli]